MCIALVLSAVLAWYQDTFSKILTIVHQHQAEYAADLAGGFSSAAAVCSGREWLQCAAAVSMAGCGGSAIIVLMTMLMAVVGGSINGSVRQWLWPATGFLLMGSYNYGRMLLYLG